MSSCLEDAVEIVDVDTFIKQAREILANSESKQTSTVNTRKKAQTLLLRFEEYLTAKGLKC